MRNLFPNDKTHKDALQDTRTLKNYIDGGISVHATENCQQLAKPSLIPPIFSHFSISLVIYFLITYTFNLLPASF